MEKTRECMLCGKQTTGSIGAAKIFWKTLCQPCKDKEDNALLGRLNYQAKVMDKLEEVLK